jgi:hypothetical protein
LWVHICQDLLAAADTGMLIFEPDPKQEGVLDHTEDAVDAPGKDDDLVPSLPQELAPPAMPALRLGSCLCLLALPPRGRGEGEHQQGERDMHPHRPCRLLLRTVQTPLLFAFLYSTSQLDYGHQSHQRTAGGWTEACVLKATGS